MSFAFPEIDPNTSGTVHSVQIPLMRYLDESFKMGEHYTVMNALSRIGDINAADADQDSPILDTEEANRRYGIGNLKFTEPVRESVAQVMRQRKRDEMDREFFLSQGSSKARIIPSFAAMMLGGISNPVDFGLMFVPFVGQEATAAKLASPVARVLARRLVTRETLREIAPRAPLLAESMINGAVGQTLFEVPNVIAASKDGENYGMTQASINIAAGGGLAAAFHGAVRLYGAISAGTKEVMAKRAMNQYLSDEAIRVDELVRVDREANAAAIGFDPVQARINALEEIDVAQIADDIPYNALDPEESKAWNSLVDEEVERQVQEYIARERVKHEQAKQGKFEAAKQQELEQQVAEGRTLPTEEVQKSIPPEKFEEVTDENLGIEPEMKSAEKETAEKKGVVDELIAMTDEHIKSLSKPSDKSFTGITGLEPIIAMVGKEVTKGLLIAFREGLKLFKDVSKALDHAMEWYRKDTDSSYVGKELYAKGKKAVKKHLAAVEKQFSPKNMVAHAKELVADSIDYPDYVRGVWQGDEGYNPYHRRQHYATAIANDAEGNTNSEIADSFTIEDKRPRDQWPSEGYNDGSLPQGFRYREWSELTKAQQKQVIKQVELEHSKIIEEGVESNFHFGSGNELGVAFRQLRDAVPEIQQFIDEAFIHRTKFKDSNEMAMVNKTEDLDGMGTGMPGDRDIDLLDQYYEGYITFKELLADERFNFGREKSPYHKAYALSEVKEILNEDQIRDLMGLTDREFWHNWPEYRREVYEADPGLGAFIDDYVITGKGESAEKEVVRRAGDIPKDGPDKHMSENEKVRSTLEQAVVTETQRTRAEIRAAMKEQPKPMIKSIDAAVDCILRKIA